jgi:hypothetical protein
MIYIFLIFNNHIINNDVNIHPIISNQTNQSGPLISTGKSVFGDIQLKNVNPVKNAGKFILSIHDIKYASTRLSTRTT